MMENNLSCDDLKTLISVYFDNELSEEESEMLISHLDKCPLCTQELENIRNLSGLIKNSVNTIEFEDIDIASTVINRLYKENLISCDEVLNEMSCYLDGEVDLKLHYLIEDHLNNCSACKSEFDMLEKLSNSIKLSFEIDNDIDLCSKIIPKFDNIELCREISEKLSEYLDKELPREDAVKVSEHLLACKYCRRDYDNLKEISLIVKNYLKKSSYSPEILNLYSTDEIMARLDKSERRRVFLTSVAAVFLMAILSWFSISTVEPTIINQPEKINMNESGSLKAEDFLFNKAYSTPSEGAISVLYEND